MPPTPKVRFTLLETTWGACGLAWTDEGIAAVHLPGQASAAVREALQARLPGAEETVPPPQVCEVGRRIQASFAGAPQRFDDLVLDFGAAPRFHRQVWEAARALGPGQTESYGELAARLGSPGAARAVGQALAKNPLPLLVPCHRVLAAGRAPGGFSAFGGLRTKARMLELEGVALHPQRSLFGDAQALPFDARAAVGHLREADPKLAAVIGAVGPLRLSLEAMASPFEALAESIVYQQLHGKAAATIVERLQALWGGRFPTPQELLATRAPRLRKVGLSVGKQAAMRDLAARTLAGTVPDRGALEIMDDEAIVERLTQVRGIGRWTAEMLLIFRLGRPDVLPLGDYGVRKGCAVMLGRAEPVAPAVLARRGERWRPFRTAASWYLWRATELPRGALR